MCRNKLPLAMTRLAGLAFACLAVTLSLCFASAASLDIEVALEPEHTGVPIPISLDVGELLPVGQLSPKTWRLEELPSGHEVPYQVDGDTGKLRFMIEVPAGSKPVKKLFRLRPGSQSRTDTVRVEHTDRKHLTILEGKRPVLAYNYQTVLPEGIPEDWRRSSYLHPIYGLNGETLTDDFPADHLHHRGLSWMWTHVKVGGNDYDLWAIKGIRQRFTKLLCARNGEVSGTLRVANGWYTNDGRKVMDETVGIEVFRAGDMGRIVDVELAFKATNEPVTIESSGRGYGGFNFRFAPRTETSLTTSSGKLEKDVDRERYLWSDLSAQFGQSPEFSGVAIFDHPDNPSHPTGWSNRFYGILNPSFTGIEPVTIKPDSPLRVRYRMWIHKGDAVDGDVARMYKAYVRPPKTRVSVVKGD